METRRSWPDVWGTAAWDGCQLREESRVPQGGSGVKVQVVTGTALSFPLVPGGKSLKAPSLGPCLVRVTASVTLAGHRPRAKAEDAGMTIPAECWVRTTHRHLRPSQSHPVPQPRGPRSGGDGASTTNSSRDGASSPQTPPSPPPRVSLAFPAGPLATMGRGSSSLRQPPPGGPRAGPVLCPGRGSSSEHPVRTPCGFIPGCRAQWGVLQDDARRRGAAGPVGLSRGRSGFSSRCWGTWGVHLSSGPSTVCQLPGQELQCHLGGSALGKPCPSPGLSHGPPVCLCHLPGAPVHQRPALGTLEDVASYDTPSGRHLLSARGGLV